MKLQFAFGNPRRAKKAKSKGKKVAKRHTKRKTSSVNLKSKKIRKAILMAKSKRRKRSRKNPAAAVVRKNGKIAARVFSPLSKTEEHKLSGRIEAALSKYKKAAPASAERSAAYKELVKVKKEATGKLSKRHAYLKTLQRYTEEGAKITEYDLAAKKGAKSVAKKKKRKSKKARKASAKKVTRKAKRTKKRKSTKRRSKAQKAALRKMLAANKAKRKGSKKRKSTKRRKSSAKRRKSSKRRYPKMVAHKHAASTRHIRKGSTAKFSGRGKKGKFKVRTYFGKGKRKVKMTGTIRRKGTSGLSGIFKLNPFRSNPMKANVKKYTGLEMKEVQVLALGAAAAPLSAAFLSKVPGISQVSGLLAQYIPVQYQSAVLNLLAGAALNVGADYAPAGGAKKALSTLGEGLAAASIISLVSAVVTDGLRMSGMAGINYTPSMRGINYTPNMGIMPTMNGINYTPSMGIMPQLNGMGSSPDFGSANYGGGGGSKEARTQRSDFGAWESQDSEGEPWTDDENSLSSSMN